MMKLKKLPYKLTVCKVRDVSAIDLSVDICFVGRTDEEISLVCRTEDNSHADLSSCFYQG